MCDGEVLDRMDAADEDVAQGLATRFGIVDRLNCTAHIVLRGLGHRVDEGHGLLATARRGHRRLAIGVLLKVPLGERFVVSLCAYDARPLRHGVPGLATRFGASRFGARNANE